jgi:cell division protein FtsB
MGLVGEMQRRARHVVGPLLGIVAVAYFAYHTVHGERGVLAYLQMRERVAEAERRFAAVELERTYWERRVKLLHPASIDPDMLDERVRVMLGYARADDLIVLMNSTGEKGEP